MSSIFEDFLNGTKVVLPEFNGLPQMWTKDNCEGLRIVYPDGRVSYWYEDTRSVPVEIKNERVIYKDIDGGHWVDDGCTSDTYMKNQVVAVLQCIKHCIDSDCNTPEFVGYIGEIDEKANAIK